MTPPPHKKSADDSHLAKRQQDAQARGLTRSRSESSLPPTPVLQRAIQDPWSARPETILALQGTIGNQAVQRMITQQTIQRKFQVRPQEQQNVPNENEALPQNIEPKDLSNEEQDQVQQALNKRQKAHFQAEMQKPEPLVVNNIDEVVDACQAMVNNSLNGESLQTVLTKYLRTDMGGLRSTLGLSTTNKPVREEAQAQAKLFYVSETQNFQTNLQKYEIDMEMPSFEELSEEKIKKVSDTLMNDQRIQNLQDAIDHWPARQFKALQEKKPVTYEEHLQEFGGKVRNRVVGSWTQAAHQALVAKGTFGDLFMNRTNQNKVHWKPIAREGRDFEGRLGYYLMGRAPKEIMSDVGIKGAECDDTGDMRGIGKLGVNMAHIFDQAACHEDAEAILHLLSGGQSAAGTIMMNDGNVDQTVEQVLSDVKACSGPVKLVKLSNYNNHSVLYLIGDDGAATRLETRAGHNTSIVLVNDVIAKGKTLTMDDAAQRITDGLKSVVQSGYELKYEVHEAATVEEVEQRLQGKLRDSATMLSVGLAVGRAQMRDTLEGIKLVDPEMDIPLSQDKAFRVPINKLGQETLRAYKLDSNAEAGDLQVGTDYRLNYQGLWMLVKLKSIQQQGEPAWMYPAYELEIVKLDQKYAQPIIVQQGDKSTALAMMNGYRDLTNNCPFSPQQYTNRSVQGLVLAKGSDLDNPITIVEDANWADGKVSRKIKYRPGRVNI